MPIQVKCPNPECAQALRAKDELAGKALRCPACKTVIKLPGNPVANSPSVTPAPPGTRPSPKPAPSATPLPPAKKASPTATPAPARSKTPGKPTTNGSDDPFDFDDEQPLKAKVTDKPSQKNAPDKAPSRTGKGKQNDDYDDFTDEPVKKGKAKKADDYDDYDDDYDAPKKNGKAKKSDDYDDDPPRKSSKSKKEDYDDDYDDKPKKGGKSGKGGKQRDSLDDLPDTLWEDCDLFRHPRLATKGKFSIWKNSFRILNPDTDEEIGQAEENLPTWKGWLRMFRIGPIVFANWLTVDVEIREDPEGPVLFYMRKLATPMPWQLTSTIEILDFRKRRIGYFKTKLFSITGGFWIYDDNEEQVAELKGKFSFTKPRMDFLDVDGELLGDICMSIVDDQGKKKKGFQFFFGAIPMVMTMKKHVRDHIPTKVLFLAATMAQHLAYHRSGARIG